MNLPWRKRELMPGHAESHNDLASLLDIHLEQPVTGSDPLVFSDHVELHNQIRQRIIELQERP